MRISPNHWIFLWARFLPPRPVCALATIGPVGTWGKAPGTLGSVVGLLLYAVVFHFMAPIVQLLVCALLLFLTVGICDAAERHFQQRDPGKIILDEVVAVPIVFIGLAPAIAVHGGWPVLLAGFLLFRLFDIIKPFGISKLQNLPGGLGCAVDDTAAALAAALCLNIGLLLLNLAGP